MTAEIYLIAPTDADPAGLAAALRAAIDLPGAVALLLPRGGHSAAAYAQLVRSVAADVQARGLALLIEGEPADVRALGADGLHVTGPIAAVRAAVAALKPDFIVGAGDVHSRHDAMERGELDVDYVMFGPLSGPVSATDRELARWWAETMQIPGVFSDPEASSPAAGTEGCDFVGLNMSALEPVR